MQSQGGLAAAADVAVSTAAISSPARDNAVDAASLAFVTFSFSSR